MKSKIKFVSKTARHLDVHSEDSSLKGWKRPVEIFFRKFRTAGFGLMLAPISLLYVACMGISLTPGVMLYHLGHEFTHDWSIIAHSITLGFSMAAGFLMYGVTLVFVVPFFNKILFLNTFLKPQRSSWFSLSVIPWYYHNALTYLVRYTFLDFITPTPLNKLFYQMMGMKVGKGTMINTSNISDPCLIELGDYVTIGGSATLVAHYGMKGFLVVDKLIIKNGATIGLRANIFGDVVVGAGVTVKPNEVVYPKTRIPDRDLNKMASKLGESKTKRSRKVVIKKAA
ncbi:MAG: hypothetical protein QE271_03160 [Bacteriovoracaceae bacterium]|nr:hypothetical protein [Bacteriovoracaceae bacterium]